MRKTVFMKLISFLFITVVLVGCSADTDHSDMNHSDMNHSDMDHSDMDHSDMDHSDMDHSDMEKPLPKTKDMVEVVQQDVANTFSDFHAKGIKGAQVKVAVLDTGIDISSKDLEFSQGTNFVDSAVNDFDDDHGHGTKIAGIIGARENDYNLLGLAPQSDLYVAKVADEHGNVSIENLIKGIEWSIEKNVDIINMSLELPEGSKELHSAIKKAYDNNIIILASSGNIKYSGDTDLSYPGAYEEVINVGMLNTDGKIFADEFKDKEVDVFAPGEDVFSSYLNEKMTLDTAVSFSTAYASGCTALLLQSYQDDNVEYSMQMVLSDLKEWLEQNM
ncbi:S8 family serine peptidase [Bacillus sp. FSL W7-1360]